MPTNMYATGAALSEDETQVALVGEGPELEVWHVREQTPTLRVEVAGIEGLGVAIAPNGGCGAVSVSNMPGDPHPLLQVWRLKDAARCADAPYFSGALAWSPDGSLIAAAGNGVTEIALFAAP